VLKLYVMEKTVIIMASVRQIMDHIHMEEVLSLVSLALWYLVELQTVGR